MSSRPKSDSETFSGAKEVVEEFLGFKGDAALIAPKANLTIASMVWYYRTLPSGEKHRFAVFFDPKTSDFTLIYGVNKEKTTTSINLTKNGEVIRFNDSDSVFDTIGPDTPHYVIKKSKTDNPKEFAEQACHRLIEELNHPDTKRDKKAPFWGNHPKPSGWNR